MTPTDRLDTTDSPAPEHARPYVTAEAGSLSLHFSSAQLQSSMRTDAPWQLAVDYTLTLAGFLLFNPQPKRIAMVGLGGGSLVKFCHRHLLLSHMTAVEINPHVIALRELFHIPPDDARLEILQADGVDFVAAQSGELDVLLIDGFDRQGQPAALCSQAFYHDCFSALAPGGVLAVNLHQGHVDHALYAERIRRSFAGNAVEIDAPEQGNCVVFASRGSAISPRALKTQAALAVLDSDTRRQLRPEFARIAWLMKDLSD